MPSPNKFFDAVSPYFRKRRFERLEEYLQPAPHETMLDVGGTAAMWKQFSLSVRAIHLLNLDYTWLKSETPGERPLRPFVADALHLPVTDGEYDIVFSNSVIEHVSTWANQLRFAEEVRRAGKRLWVQTPAREFPVEPHYILPLVHYFPKVAQRSLVRWFFVRGWLTHLSHAEVERLVDEIRLLTYEEMKVLFPDCLILRETFAGMIKSYVAFRA